MLFVVQFNKQAINGLFYSLLQLITKEKNHTSSTYFHSIERNTLFNNYSLSQINNKKLDMTSRFLKREHCRAKLLLFCKVCKNKPLTFQIFNIICT